MKNVKDKISSLVEYLNVCRYHYYNNNTSIISDQEYDELYDQLEQLEKESGFVLANSPTQTVGYPVNKNRSTVTHEIPLLSLKNCKEIPSFSEFCSKSETLLMHKLDGLTCLLTYDNGNLVAAETRGNGITGEDIFDNAHVFIGVPSTIPDKRHIHVIGEAIISYTDFDMINETVIKSGAEPYSNPRNLASGSATHSDPTICKNRFVRFVVWNANDLSTDGKMLSGMIIAKEYGFNIVHTIKLSNSDESSIDSAISNMRLRAKKDSIPIDGIVAMYNDIEYGKSLGATDHHPRCGLAFKFYEDVYTSVIQDIEWSIGRTGVLTPVAIFDPKDIEGTSVSRASLSNITIMNSLNLHKGDSIGVIKADAIIPQIKCNLSESDHVTASNKFIPPNTCPYCGGKTIIRKQTDDSDSEYLYCDNYNCAGALSKRIEYFCSKQCANIDGFAEKTVKQILEIYPVKSVSEFFITMPEWMKVLESTKGFGKRSVAKLTKSFEKSKKIKLANFINALGINEVGKVTARVLSDLSGGTVDGFKKLTYTKLSSCSGIGSVTAGSVYKWLSDEDNIKTMNELLTVFTVADEECVDSYSLSGSSFAITGLLNNYSRSELEEMIMSNGGSVVSSVTRNTTYLITNEESNSSKYRNAVKYGVKIISESEFISMIGNNNTQSISDDVMSGRLF